MRKLRTSLRLLISSPYFFSSGVISPLIQTWKQKSIKLFYYFSKKNHKHFLYWIEESDTSGKESVNTDWCKRHEFSPWVRKISWSRKRQPTAIFLPGKSHGQRSLADYSPWGCRESNVTERLSSSRIHVLLEPQQETLSEVRIFATVA